MTVDRARNKSADTGGFELVYKQPIGRHLLLTKELNMPVNYCWIFFFVEIRNVFSGCNVFFSHVLLYSIYIIFWIYHHKSKVSRDFRPLFFFFLNIPLKNRPKRFRKLFRFACKVRNHLSALYSYIFAKRKILRNRFSLFIWGPGWVFFKKERGRKYRDTVPLTYTSYEYVNMKMKNIQSFSRRK